MCGLVYAHNFNGTPVNNDVLDLYDNQKSRGTEGFGLFDGSHLNLVRATTENKILKWLCNYDSNLLLFHHRWPTSTMNVKKAAHPFATKKHFGDKQYIMVHNGIIENAYDLFDEHQEQGIEYQSLLDDLTFNDSEALLWDFASYMEGKQKELKAYGSIAFICMRINKGKLDKLYFARNYSNPLTMLRTKGGIRLSSQGVGESIEVHTLYTWHYDSKRLTTKAMKVPSMKPYVAGAYDNNYYTGYDGGYDSYADSDFDVLTADDMTWLQRQRRLLADKFNVEDNDYILEEMEDYRPDTEIVQKIAFDYLNVANGHFESAYYNIEQDIVESESKAKWLADYRYLRQLEMAQVILESDPEYLTNKSMSSMFKKGAPDVQLKLTA